MKIFKLSVVLLSLLSLTACGGGGGSDEADLDISQGGNSFCLNTCDFANDGECDDTGPGAVSSVCVLGTDCNDCGSRPAPAPGPNNLSCSDECVFSRDGECDDGSDPNFSLVCPPATDCSDCGARDLTAAFPGAFSRTGIPSFDAWLAAGALSSDKLEKTK